MSTAVNPVAPAPVSGDTSTLARRPPERPYRGMVLVALVLGVAIAGTVIYWNRKGQLPAPAEMGIRAAAIQAGTVTRTVRLSGTTQARNFYSLLTPELHGSRSGRNRTASAASAGSTSPGATSPGTTASSSTTASGASAASSSSTAASSAAPGASQAFQTATSRFGGTLRGSVPASQSSAMSGAAQTPVSAAVGPSGLGSTGDSLPGGPNGAPAVGASTTGDSEWQLVLQDVVPPGSRVTKDQVIAEFDRQYMLVRLDDYRESVAESQAALKTQDADLEAARKAHEQTIRTDKGTLEKARLDMRTIPVLSAIDAERTRLAFDEAQARYEQVLQEVPYLKKSQDAQVRNSELDLAEAKLELKRAQDNAEKMIVRAPADGLAVMETTWRGGEFGKIQKGDQVWPGEPFMKVVDTSFMLVTATVNQVDVEQLRLGANAKVNFDAYPGLSLNASVESIGAMTMEPGQRENFVRQIPVRFRIEFPAGKPDPRVIPDLTVSVDVEVAAPVRSDTVAPRGAIFRDRDGGSFVYVKDGTGWSPHSVRIGARNSTVVAIVSGVSVGEVVALDRPPSTGSQ